MAEPPFTEPVPIPCLFIDGVVVEFAPSFARLIAWTDIPLIDRHERRIMGRWVLPNDVAHLLERDLRKGLSKGPKSRKSS